MYVQMAVEGIYKIDVHVHVGMDVHVHIGLHLSMYMYMYGRLEDTPCLQENT